MAGAAPASFFLAMVWATDGSKRDRGRSVTRNRGLATHEGACFTLIERMRIEGVLRERIVRCTTVNHDASDATLELLDSQLKLREPVAAGEDALLFPPTATRPRWCNVARRWRPGPQEARRAVGELPLIAHRHP